MKIRHPLIAIIALTILAIIVDELFFSNPLHNATMQIIAILMLICFGLIIYLIIRNIFRAIRGAVTGEPQNRDYRDEARRACEKVTPKRDKNAAPPWEE